MKKEDILRLFPVETERLVLRSASLSDARLIQDAKEARSDILRKWMAWSDEEGMSMQGTLSFLHLCLAPDNRRDIGLLALDKATGALAVMSGFNAEDDDFRIFSTGWWVGEGFEGKGLAFEAMSKLLELARSPIGAELARASFYEGNARSQSLMERLGFQHTQTHIKNHRNFLDGALMDTFDYEYKLEA